MQCLEKTKVVLQRRLSAEEFLHTHPILRQRAREAARGVMDYVSDGFLPEIQPGESYEGWVARQVQDVLNTQLWWDMAGGHEHQGQGVHTCQYVDRVEFDEKDRQFITHTFGQRPDIRRLWLSRQPQQQADAA